MRGDYYGRGDYYQGDPGIGSFFGGLFRGIVKGVGTGIKLFTNPVGAAVDIAHQITGGGAAPAGTPLSQSDRTAAAVNAVGASSSGVNPGSLMRPGGMGGPSPFGGGGMAMALVPHGRRSHPNKSTYVIRGGGTSRWGAAGQLQVIQKGTVPVPNRRMNVANPRALRRSLRRVAGFAKLTKRVRRAVSMAASAVGIHHRRGKATIRRK